MADPTPDSQMWSVGTALASALSVIAAMFASLFGRRVSEMHKKFEDHREEQRNDLAAVWKQVNEHERMFRDLVTKADMHAAIDPVNRSIAEVQRILIEQRHRS